MSGKRIVIIGAGPGGYIAAIRAAVLNGKVTLIEKHHLGGTCLNYGCIPSKIMKTSADIFLKIIKAKIFGININGSIDFDMKALMAKKEKILDVQKKGIATLLKSHNINVEKGRAFIKPNKIVEIISDDNTKKELEYDKLIIATGTKPLNIKAFEFNHKTILSSDDLLQLDHVPKSIVIVGGGVIGCEFAFILSALGSDVTIVEAMSRLLPLVSIDKECSRLLLREAKKRKIKVICDAIVKSADIDNNGVSINLDMSSFTDNLEPKKLRSNIIKADKIAVCIGRSAMTSNLGVENIGLKINSQGWIQANESMETNIKGVFAIGDILGPDKSMLAHVASHEGIIAAQNAMGMQSKMDYSVIPSAIFTMPEIGAVGLSEEQAREHDIKSFKVNFRVLGKAFAIDEIEGFAKMIIEKKTNRILGVHIIGAHATDLIAQATLAIKKGLTPKDIADTIHAHPTLSEIMAEVSKATY